MPRAIVFELEASRIIGFGHLRRSVMIADRVRQLFPPVEIVFSGRFDKVVEQTLRRLVPEAAIGYSAASGIYRSCPGPETVVFIDQRHSAASVVLEHRRSGRMTVCIEDLGRGRGCADILVDPNLSLLLHRRVCALQKSEPHTALLGPDHVLLDPRILALRERGLVRPDRYPRVLCTFGGSDADGVSERILDMLLPAVSRYTITMVAGPLVSPDRIAALQRRGGDRITMVHDPGDMLELIASADLLVTVPGVTLWEAACLGVPAVLTWVHPHQRRMARAFSARKWCVNAGPLRRLEGGLLDRALRHLSAPAGARREIQDRLLAGVDGLGLDRLMESIFGGILIP